MHLITLTTDFGARDWFVGTMKGVILGIAPHARLVDITHEVPAGDIRAGAFALAAACRFFPKGTVHLAVVDPGVGSKRRAVAAQTADYFFVGPDNGVLAWALAREKIKAVRALENEKFFLNPVSKTFHGRDIFSPVAAHLLNGVAIRKFGPPTKDFVRLPWPAPKRTAHSLRGEIVYFDRFGNAITNLPAELVPAAATCTVAGRRTRAPLACFFQAVPLGKPVAVIGSAGLLEIAINGGSAANMLRLKIGDAIVVRPA